MPEFPQPIEDDALPRAVMDYCTLNVIGRVARDLLIGARVTKISGLPSGDILIAFDRYHVYASKKSETDPLPDEYKSVSNSEFNNWLISADPRQFRVHPVDDKFPAQTEQSHLVEVLSFHLSGAKVEDVSVVPLERVISFSFSRREYTGEINEYRLIAELMGKHSNIILVDSTDNILATHKPVHSYQSRVREIRAGKPYKLPPRQDRIEPREFNDSDWSDFVKSAGVDVTVDDHIARTFHGMSIGWARVVAITADVDPEKPAADINPGESEKLRDALSDTTKIVHECHPLTGESRINFTRRVSLDFTERAEDFEIDRRRKDLMKVIEKRRRKLKALGKGLSRDIERAGKAENFKKKADLLLANLHNVQPGDENLDVEDWETGEKMSIDIAQHLSPQLQAENWYKRYRKLKRTQDIAAERKSVVCAEQEELELLSNRASEASSLDDIHEVRGQCILHGLISVREKFRSNRDKSKRQQAATKPVIGSAIRSLRYRSNDGFLIVAGLNDRANDALRRASSNEDIWLHTHEIPGGHVYIITRGKSVPDTTIKEAAIVAAWHSKARDGSNVPVNYTKAKYVTAIAGGPSGKVTYRRERMIRVTPDEKRVEMMRIMAGSDDIDAGKYK